MNRYAVPLIGGILTVIVLGLLALAPFLGLLVAPFLALPMSAISVRWGLAKTLQALVLGLMISLPLFGTSVLPMLILIAFIAGLFQLAQKNTNHLVNYLIATATIVFIVLLVLFFQYQSKNAMLPASVSNVFEQTINEINKTTLDINLPAKDVKSALKEMNSVLDQMKIMLPSLYGIGLLSFLIINLVLTRIAAGKLGNKDYVFESFRNWDIHWVFSWGFVLGIAAQLFSNRLPGPFQMVGMNLAAFFTIIFIIQGIAVGTFYFTKWKVSPYGKAVALISFVIAPPILNIMSWIGLFDIWFNYRKLDRTA